MFLSLEEMNSKLYLYHVGKAGYEDIRSISFQDKEYVKMREEEAKKSHWSKEYKEDYFQRVNGFLGDVKCSYLEAFKKHGFELYQNLDSLYLYKIDLIANKHRIIDIIVTSTKEQLDYYNVWYKRNNVANMTPDEFRNAIKNSWKPALKKYLNSKGIKDKYTLDELIKSKHLSDWKNTEKYFKHNIKCGLKNQYASCIPHLQIKITEPLVFESVKKICN